MKKIEYLILSSITLNHSFGFAHVCKILCKTNFVFNFGSFLLSFIFVSSENFDLDFYKYNIRTKNVVFNRKSVPEKLLSKCSLASMSV